MPAPNLVFDPPLSPPASRSAGQGSSCALTGPVPPGLAEAADLAARLTGRARAEAEVWVAFGCLWLDDRPCLEPGRPLAGHRHFRFNPPAYGPVRFYEADPGRIVYEDGLLLVYNKEAGRPSQAVPHDAHNNVLAALERLLAGRDGPPARLWLPHRLDADTSGLLLLAKTAAAAGDLGRAFQAGEVAKRYLALGLGPRPEQAGFLVDVPLAKEGSRYLARPGGPGLAARTRFQVLEAADFPGGTGLAEVLFQAEPLTGRTHQIRLHLAWAGWPIRGDRFYGRAEVEKDFPAPRLMLAAVGLTLPHPAEPARRLEISLEPQAI